MITYSVIRTDEIKNHYTDQKIGVSKNYFKEM